MGGSKGGEGELSSVFRVDFARTQEERPELMHYCGGCFACEGGEEGLEIERVCLPLDRILGVLFLRTGQSNPLIGSPDNGSIRLIVQIFASPI